MASSQIFCVNFWYPLKEDTALLTAILRSIDPLVEKVGEIYSPDSEGNLSLKSFVEFEWVGRYKTLEKKKYTRGANATSIDAYVIGLAGKRRIGFFFEWKMVEKYMENDLGKGKSGETRRNTYRPYLLSENSIFSKNIPISAVLFEPFYQIFRMGLLGQKMIFEDNELDQVYIIPVYPKGNLAYSEQITSPWLKEHFSDLHTISEIANKFFIKPVEYRSLFAEELWDITRAALDCTRYSEWIEYMNTRYLYNG